MCRPSGGVASTMTTANVRCGTGEANRFLGLCMRLPGRDGTGRRGTEWHRVPVEIQQSGVYRRRVFPVHPAQAATSRPRTREE